MSTLTRACLAGTSALLAAVALVGSACSLDENPPVTVSPFIDGGGGNLNGGSGRAAEPITNDAGQSLVTLNAPGDPGAGAVYVTISGESNAVTGYPFPPNDFTTDTYMVDGWEF